MLNKIRKLSDTVTRKFTEVFYVDDYEVLSDEGFVDIGATNQTIEYESFEVCLDNGSSIKCADDHIFIDVDGEEVFAKDSVGVSLFTSNGPSKVVSVRSLDYETKMYDLSVNSNTNLYYTNGILSHNTTSYVAFCLWFILFNEYKTIGLMANKGETARNILGRIQLAFENLPKWMQQGVVEYNKGSFELENGCKIVACSTSSSTARGESFSVVIIDECAFVERWHEFFTSVYPTISSGTKTKIIMVSTPNGLNHFRKFYVDAKEGRNNYNVVECIWKDVPGRDEQWRKDTLAAMGGDVEKFLQEYENNFIGSSGALIASWKLKDLVHLPPEFEREGLKIYEEAFPDRNYTAIVDGSEGKGLDYCAVQIIDVTEMPYKQVAVFHSNQITPTDFSDVVFGMCRKYNDALLLIENQSTGAIVAETLHFDFEYDNLIYTESGGRDGKRVSFGFGRGKKEKGVKTTKSVKRIGCSMMKMMIEQDQLIINDFETIQELSTFVKRGSSYEAEEGQHDDLVMCLVLFAWLSDQQYFKNMTSIDTINKLRNRDDEDDLLPGFVVLDGLDEEPVVEGGEVWFPVI